MDMRDILILTLYDNARKDGTPMPSVKELLKAIPDRRSTGTIQRRLQLLVGQGLLIKPAKNLPRSYRISEKGIQLLKLEKEGIRDATKQTIRF